MKCKLLIIFSIMALLQGCGAKKNIESQDTQSTQMNPSSVQEDVKNISETSLFSDISNFDIDNPKTYINQRFKFSVDYPESWKIQRDDSVYTGSPDGDPQSGVYIYINCNKDDTIYVYGQNGHIGMIGGYGMISENFKTSEGVTGDLIYSRSEGIITVYIVLEEGFHGVSIFADEKVFDENKQQILGVLKSIKINQE